MPGQFEICDAREKHSLFRRKGLLLTSPVICTNQKRPKGLFLMFFMKGQPEICDARDTLAIPSQAKACSLQALLPTNQKKPTKRHD